MFTSNKTWFCRGLETEKAKEIVDKLNDAIDDGNHAEATELFNQLKKYMRKRINDNYFSPVERINVTLHKLEVPENTAFITVSICCILIELYFEMVNGYDKSQDSGCVANAYRAVLPLLDSNISKSMADIFYKGIRCGILHQAQTKKNTALTYEIELIFEKNGPYYLSNPNTVFENLKDLYADYWEMISIKNYCDKEGKKLIAKLMYILKQIE